MATWWAMQSHFHGLPHSTGWEELPEVEKSLGILWQVNGLGSQLAPCQARQHSWRSSSQPRGGLLASVWSCPSVFPMPSKPSFLRWLRQCKASCKQSSVCCSTTTKESAAALLIRSIYMLLGCFLSATAISRELLSRLAIYLATWWQWYVGIYMPCRHGAWHVTVVHFNIVMSADDKYTDKKTCMYVYIPVRHWQLTFVQANVFDNDDDMSKCFDSLMAGHAVSWKFYWLGNGNFKQ